VIERLRPPHPAPGLSTGHGVEALVLAMLDGPHGLDKGGQRLEERGRVPLLPPGLTPAALPADRWGHILEARCAAHLTKSLSALARTALEVYALPTPWLHQDTTTLARSGAYADEPTPRGAPRPAYGHRQDGRAALTQVRLRLGVSGDGGLPLRGGLRAGNPSERIDTPLAMEECLALGLAGGRGIVAERTGDRRRTRGGCLDHGRGFVPFVPRPCAVRQALAAWGQQHPALPRLVAKPGRTTAEAPRRWQGPRGLRQVAGASSAGRGSVEALRCVVGQARQLAHQHTPTEAAAHAQEAAAVADHGQQVQARWVACAADAAAASAA
jgi:hypothetical protein